MSFHNINIVKGNVIDSLLGLYLPYYTDEEIRRRYDSSVMGGHRYGEIINWEKRFE